MKFSSMKKKKKVSKTLLLKQYDDLGFNMKVVWNNVTQSASLTVSHTEEDLETKTTLNNVDVTALRGFSKMLNEAADKLDKKLNEDDNAW